MTFTITEEDIEEVEYLDEEEVDEMLEEYFGDVLVNIVDEIDYSDIWFEYYGENKELEQALEELLQEMHREE